jgi:hypothetical protein
MSADLTSVGERIRSVAVDIAWQMWSALGVSSWESRTPRSVIELEPLIALTAVGAWDDRRLVSQAVDWCVANADLVSLHQMRRVVEDNEWPFEGPIAEFGATAGHFMRKPWPGVRSEQPFLRDLPLKSKPPDLRDPALIALRLRAVFGVGARSEILRFLLFHPWPNTAAQIAREIPYGERQITKDLRLLNACRHHPLIDARIQRGVRAVRRVRAGVHHRRTERTTHALGTRIPTHHRDGRRVHRLGHTRFQEPRYGPRGPIQTAERGLGAPHSRALVDEPGQTDRRRRSRLDPLVPRPDPATRVAGPRACADLARHRVELRGSNP